MSVRAAQMVHYAGIERVLRAQNIGITNLNIPAEKVSEVGRDASLETIYDTPQMSWEVESLDLRTAFEQKINRLTGGTALSEGDSLRFNDAIPLDVISPWRLKSTSGTVRGGYIAPFLNLEQVRYRFGATDSGNQTFTFAGDGAFFVPGGSPRYAEFTKADEGPYSFANTALATELFSVDRFALSVMAVRNDGTFRRLLADTDYTQTNAGFTLTAAADAEFANTTTKLCVVYGTATQDTINDTVGADVTTIPSAVKGRHIDLYIEDSIGETLIKWSGVTSFEASWRVTFEEDRELGNPYAVARDYDVPEVSGNIVMRPRDVDYLIARLAQINGADPAKIQNVESPVPLRIEARVRDPKDAETVMKTIVIPDARINVPGPRAQSRQKADMTFPFNSDGGNMLVYEGAPA